MEATRRSWIRAIAVVGVLGVVAYVAAWVVGGIVWDGYDPTRQAISELFAQQAPVRTRLPLTLGLVFSGVALVAFGWALHVTLPGRSPVGPALAALSGVMTVGIVAVPCTAGCPGFGTSVTDSLHVAAAGIGYTALAAAPLAVGWRVRHRLPGLATASWVLGGGALAIFLVHTAGVASASSAGLLQRVFNTTADLWYVLAAVVVVRETRTVR